MRSDGHLAPLVLVDQNRKPQAPRAARLKLAVQEIHAVPGVHDVLDNEHMLAFERDFHVLGERDRLGTLRRAAVAGEAHKIEFRLTGEMPDEIGKKHERALEHAHHDQRLVFIKCADLSGHFLDARLDGFFADQRFEIRNTHVKGSFGDGNVPRGGLDFQQDRRFVAVREFGAIHAVHPNLLGQHFLFHNGKAERIKKGSW